MKINRVGHINASNIILGLTNRCIKYGLTNWIPDELFLKYRYRQCIGKKLDLKNPTTYNEKLQWLKLYDRKQEYSIYVDKYEVRDFIKTKIGDEYLIPLISVYDSVDEIEWDELPNKFVLKCTHGSGCNIICKDKSLLDINNVKKQLKIWMHTNYFFSGREWPYKNVKPRIICEKYMVDDKEEILNGSKITSLTDYKFYCFNGKPEYCQVIRDRSTVETKDFYDINWNLMDFTGLHAPNKPFPHSKQLHKKPAKYDHMVNIAKKLSQKCPFVRVDLYYIQGKVYFGELTFYPFSGFGVFDPPEWNIKIGNLIKLDPKINTV